MNIPSVKVLSNVKQPIFKNTKGRLQTYGETSKKDLIRLAYIYSQEAQNFMKGMELFKTKYTALLFLSECKCEGCASSWAEEADLYSNEE